MMKRSDRYFSLGRLARLPLLVLLLLPLVAWADSFVVRDMRVEGLQRISEGTVFNYLPINIGDTVEFTSLAPYRVIVSGRIKHFISAFGEHVIGKEVEQALKEAIEQTGISVNEFTVAPQINPSEGLPYHEWFIEFEREPKSQRELIEILEKSLQNQNSYYFDLIEGKVLKSLVITKVKKDGFQTYMKSIGKLGGQNKIPRLSNDRNIVDELYNLELIK